MTSLLILLALFFLLSPSHCLYRKQPSDTLGVQPLYACLYIFWSFRVCLYINFGDGIYSFCWSRIWWRRRKQGWGQRRRAVTTNATSATHAWRCKCRRYRATTESGRKITRGRRPETGTPITSHWGGNVDAVAIFTTLREIEIVKRIEMRKIESLYASSAPKWN